MEAILHLWIDGCAAAGWAADRAGRAHSIAGWGAKSAADAPVFRLDEKILQAIARSSAIIELGCWTRPNSHILALQANTASPYVLFMAVKWFWQKGCLPSGTTALFLWSNVKFSERGQLLVPGTIFWKQDWVSANWLLSTYRHWSCYTFVGRRNPIIQRKLLLWLPKVFDICVSNVPKGL